MDGHAIRCILIGLWVVDLLLCTALYIVTREVESLRHTARRIVKFNHDTDCATGHTECSACHGTVNPYARYCEHCGARLEDA